MNYGSHPVNLGLRFLLEMAALFAAAWWAWSQHEGWLQYVLVISLPVFLAVIWGVFTVPDDPSRSGKTVVVTPGWLRLIIELFVFGFGIWSVYDLGYPLVSFCFFALVIVHYIFSYDRVRWLLTERS